MRHLGGASGSLLPLWGLTAARAVVKVLLFKICHVEKSKRRVHVFSCI